MTNDGNMIEEEQPTGSSQTTQAQTIQPSTNQPIQLSADTPPFQPSTTCLPVQPYTTRQPNSTSQPIQPTTSYANFAAQRPHNTGAIPKTTQKPIQHSPGFWTDQVKQIITDHNQGNRTLILMRGVPGSGKSYLARQLVDMMVGASANNYNTHILTTDDYFMVRGQYQHDKYKLPEAHTWNQNRARNACIAGLSPIIIDNTNIEHWEMMPYVKEGIRNGYIIQCVEPKTPWAEKPNQLAKKNVHSVPIASIRRMLDNYERNLTGDKLKQISGFAYPGHMVPPVKRLLPPIVKEELAPKPELATQQTASTSSQSIANTQVFRTSPVDVQTQPVCTVPNPENDHPNGSPKAHKEEKNRGFPLDQDDDLTDEERERLKHFIEAQKKLEEIEKVEKEWDNGDHWDTDDQGLVKGAASKVAVQMPANVTITSSLPDAKPQRKFNLSPPMTPSQKSTGSLMKNVNECEDWSKISMFMPSWGDSSEPAISLANQEVPIEKKSSGTCFEIGDTNVSGKYKVITTTPRNINEFHVSFNREKIPQIRMLDKSSMTNEIDINNAYRCPNEEQHFETFRNLFKNIARSDLRDIFDKCCGDVNWSVGIVLDGMNSNQFRTVETDELSDPEEENMEQCACLANYNIIPDVATPNKVETAPVEEKQEKLSVPANGSQAQKKKREATMSEETIQIKRQIEQNVVIADNHYSKHCLKIRKIRRGEPIVENNTEELGATGLSDAASFESNSISSNLGLSDDDNDSVSDIDDDVIVTVNLGSTFIAELDERFGRQDMQYPDFIVPKISIPMSRLNEINALWMESLTFQLDEHSTQTAQMLKQDEDFAR